MRKPIIILGGMGPQASVRLHELLLRKSSAYHDGDGDDYPYIVHFSLPLPDFINDESRKQEVVAALDAFAPTIKALQPEQVLLACNTAHVLQAEVALMRDPAFMPLLDVVAGYADSQRFQRIGLLATPTTLRTGLYDRALERYSIDCVHPIASQQHSIEAVIRRVISGKLLTDDRLHLTKIALSLQKRGAQAILLGCTELPLIFDAGQINLPVIDCLDAYADVSMQLYYLYNRRRHE